MRRLAIIAPTLGILALAAGLFLVRVPSVPVPSRGRLEITGATVVNPGVSRLEGARLVVEDGRIRTIEVVTDPGSRRHYVLPGLIDMHVHLPPWFAVGQLPIFEALFLSHGVTTIREVGGIASRPLALREQVRSGTRAGPRVFTCGTMLDGEPPSWPLARVVRNAEEGRHAVADLAAQGVDCIKVYRRINGDALAGIAVAAQARGLSVIGHLPQALPWSEHRVGEIQHVCDPRCLGMGQRAIDQLVRTAVTYGLAHTPTLVVYEGQLDSYRYAEQIKAPIAQLLPRVWREVFWNPEYQLGFEGGPDRGVHERVVARIREAVLALHRAGVPIYVGTDPFNPFVVPGASVHRELALLVEAGLSLGEAWAAATRLPGAALSEEGLGQLVEGAPADLLLFRDDPTRDLAALGTLEAVVADGRLYQIDELNEVLANQRARFDGTLLDMVSVSLARVLAIVAQERWN